jgi:hypothetical protein
LLHVSDKAPIVKRAVEGDEPRPLGVPAGQLDGPFDGFGAAVGEKHFFRLVAGGDATKSLHEFDLGVIAEGAAPQMDQVGGLFLNRGDDLVVGVAGRADGDAGGEVEETVAVEVFDDAAAGPGGGEGVVVHVGTAGGLVVSADGGEGLGAGGRHLDVGSRTDPFATGAVVGPSVADGDHVNASLSARRCAAASSRLLFPQTVPIGTRKLISLAGRPRYFTPI